VDIDESSVCVRYADKEKKGKYDEVWIDIDSGKIELFSRSEHKRNVVDVTGEFEKFNIDWIKWKKRKNRFFFCFGDFSFLFKVYLKVSWSNTFRLS